MSILMVTRELQADRRYGLGRSLLPLVDEFGRRGMKVGYLCQTDLPPERLARRHCWLERLFRLRGLRAHPHRRILLNAWVERLDMGWYAAQVAARDGYDRVHLHDPWMATGFRAARRLLGLRSVRWGLTEHGFGSYCRATLEDGLVQGPRTQRLLRRIEAATLAAADWVVAPTRAALDQLARDLCLVAPQPHWHVIPHAVPPIDRPERMQARARLGWRDDDIHVLGVGRLVPLKRFDMLVQACARLAIRYPALHLHLLGEGDRAALQRLADDVGFGSRLHFDVTDTIGLWLHAADLYVSTSATESFGLANLEALSAGMPAVCTSVGGVPEVVGDGAWLIPSDTDTLERALSTLLDDDDLRTDLAARAVARAASWPDLEVIADAYARLYSPGARH